MTAKQNGTIVGVFNDHHAAREAIRELLQAGFTESQVGVASSSQTAEGTHKSHDDREESYAGEGALAGAATGAGLGALWGLGILAGVIPAIGPAIAGGTLAVLLSSAAAGAAAAGLGGALLGMGVSKEEAAFYESEMKAGSTIVAVDAGHRRGDALAILQRWGGYDMSTRDTASNIPAPTRTLSPGAAKRASAMAHRSTSAPATMTPAMSPDPAAESHRTPDVPVALDQDRTVR